MIVDGRGPAEGLLERELELQALEQAVARACAGNGSAMVIEGHAGIGKTTLLEHARRYGASRGMRVVSASGAELERSFPYGVVRQFFESFLFTVDAGERMKWLRGTAELAGSMFREERGSNPRPAEEFALLHSLYWMCVNIADERPLLMLLDDAQWADVPSLRYVEFTCRRIEQLPFMFVVATRLPDEHAPAPLLSLLTQPSAALVRPSPLSLSAVDETIRVRLDPDGDRAFAQACHEVTGGNPFLLGELLREALTEQLPATAEGAARIRAIGPRGIAHVMLLRLRHLPDGARQLVTALSVVPDGLGLHEVAELASLDEPLAAAAAAGLASAEIVDLQHGVRFTHPVIRTTVYEDMSVIERERIHLRAARMHADHGRPAPEVAAHLMEVEPRGECWVTRSLRDAARAAVQARDFDGAARLLSRAAREAADDDNAELLAELGTAEARTGNPEGIAHLREAVAGIDDPVRRAEVSIQLATALKFSLKIDEAADVLLDAVHRLDRPSSQLGRRLHAEALGTRFIGPSVGTRISDELARLTPPQGAPVDLLDVFLLSAAAFDAATHLRPAREVVALGRRALSGGGGGDEAGKRQALAMAAAALIWAEDFNLVHERCTRALAAARSISSAMATGANSTMRAICCYRSGRLLEAESDAAAALELAPEARGLGTILPAAAAYAVLSGIERGRPLEELDLIAFGPSLQGAAHMLPYTQLSRARGELCLCRNQWEQALAHFADCDRSDPSFGGTNPAIVPWREGAALAHVRIGDRGSARALAGEAVERASQFGAPRALGFALRAAALVEQGAERIAGLDRAAAHLRTANAPLELARVLGDLGSALRAAGRRRDAQIPLEESYALANRIGAVRIAERAAEELTAVGVRPRRQPATGLAALTPSERRVAELASAGKTNREIAESLFVTQKTVETHLGHVYDKLGVRSRRKLPERLMPQPAGPAPRRG
jgi:DNA-binding CsgD family transcriptional regulator